jgi:hypothetical protein
MMGLSMTALALRVNAGIRTILFRVDHRNGIFHVCEGGYWLLSNAAISAVHGMLRNEAFKQVVQKNK